MTHDGSSTNPPRCGDATSPVTSRRRSRPWVVDENPDLTLADALRQGIIHVAEDGPTGR
jgi:hypothetical protein